jgi:hypothetical protein
MRPIVITCEEVLPQRGAEIAARLLELDRWPEFRGFGPLPGIRMAEFTHVTPEVEGTRIKVINTDRSSHVEEVIEWHPERKVRLRLSHFSRPLEQWATHFEERWEFFPHHASQQEQTRVVRTMELHVRSAAARIPLRMIAWLLKQALTRHLRQMRGARQGFPGGR